MIQPVHVSEFCHDGRGPELQRVHFVNRGTTLGGIDYFNPGDDYEAGPIRHVKFLNPQTFMVTPEEVIGDDQLGGALSRFRPAAMFDLGRSPWLSSFNPRHLAECSHFQLLFYDELFDVICESVQCGSGSFPG